MASSIIPIFISCPKAGLCNGYWVGIRRPPPGSSYLQRRFLGLPLRLGPQRDTIVQDYQLTAREIEIFHSLVEALSYKKIADKHCVSISTIRTQFCNIYHNLHVNSKAQAVAKVLGPSKSASNGKI